MHTLFAAVMLEPAGDAKTIGGHRCLWCTEGDDTMLRHSCKKPSCVDGT